MENIVNAGHHAAARLERAYVADEELDLVGNLGVANLVLVAHVILLLLVAREYADLLDIGVEEASQHRVTERAGTSRDQEGFVFEY